ncbi:MAG: SAM-dependent methyltransferase [Betaproteobacteria bacterium]
MAGILYAIPTPLGGAVADALPAPALATVRTLRHFVVENAKSARAFLKEVGMPCAIQELDISVLEADVAPHIKKLQDNHSVGLLSEAGCPAIADPGAKLVEAAQREGIRVVPFVGPSSIVLALMASGLDGQRFAFCGYLPREPEERKKKIGALESRSRREHETQIFIETPYRNDAMLAALLETCTPGTRLCVASDLTLDSEDVRTKPVAAWRAAGHMIGKRPTVFLLLAK